MDKLTNRDAGLLTVPTAKPRVPRLRLDTLFVQENYLQYRPFTARNDAERLQIVANAATYISHGDIMNRSVRMKQNWGLMPYANMVSSVMPASMVAVLKAYE